MSILFLGEWFSGSVGLLMVLFAATLFAFLLDCSQKYIQPFPGSPKPPLRKIYVSENMFAKGNYSSWSTLRVIQPPPAPATNQEHENVLAILHDHATTMAPEATRPPIS